MRSNQRFYVLVLAGCCWTFAGCNRADVEAPRLTLVVNGTVAPGMATAQAGKSLWVTMELSDDQELARVELDLHCAVGHGHEGMLPDPLVLHSGAEDWEETDVDFLEGSSALVNKQFDIPSHIRGVWDLWVNASDASGQSTTSVGLQIRIDNDSIPLFELDWNEVPIWEAGLDHFVPGQVADEDGLALVILRLMGPSGELLQEASVPVETGDTLVSLSDVTFTVPFSVEGALCQLEMYAQDEQGHACTTQVELLVN